MDEHRNLLETYIQRFLLCREALFRKNSVCESVMKSFDCFYAEYYPDSAILAQEMVFYWMEGGTASHGRGRPVKSSIIRKFAMCMNGICGAAYLMTP